MKKTRILVLCLFIVLLCVPTLFAEGYRESQTANARMENSAANKLPAPKVIATVDMFGSSGAHGVTRPAVSGKSIVGASHPRAAMAGFKILEQGGTAFDAAVAIAGVQSIVDPSATQILGGDAEIMVYSAKDQKIHVYNGTGWAPEAATLDYYLEIGGIPQTGPLSIEVPGAWAGWMLMLEENGTLPLSQILAPVIETASENFVDQTGTGMDHKYLQNAIKGGTANKTLSDLYTKDDGSFYQIGDVFSNPDFVNTLKKLVAASENGKTIRDGYRLAEDYFYRGPIAETIVKWSEENGGLFTYEDFSEFRAEKQEPWSTNYRGYDVYVCPPNSQGPTLLEALNMVENYDLSDYEHNSAEYVDLIVQVLNLAMLDRNNNLGDPRFIDNPKELISKEYAKERIKDITLGLPMEDIPEGMKWTGYEGDTTFFYVADKYGNVVTSTHSICNFWGSACVAGDTGIVLNNRMIYFSLYPEMPNVMAPRKRTLQTITPTIALKDGKPAFVVGTPGGDGQEQEKLQIILNAIDYGMTNPQVAIEASRFKTSHPAGLMNQNQFPKTITVESGMSPETVMALEDMGYTVQIGMAGMSIGHARFIDEYKWGGYDPRIYGYAVAW